MQMAEARKKPRTRAYTHNPHNVSVHAKATRLPRDEGGDGGVHEVGERGEEEGEEHVVDVPREGKKGALKGKGRQPCFVEVEE